MTLRNALLAATLVALPAAAMAQPVDGLYVSLGAGFNYLQEQKISVNSANGASAKLKGDGGFIGLAAVGYGLGNGLRIELEGDYRQQHMRVSHQNSGVQGGGQFQTYGPMVNAVYDFDIGQFFIPHVGIGAGYQETQANSATIYSTQSNAVSGYIKDGRTQGGFAAQAILGASMPIDGVPGLSLGVDYRFMSVVNNEKFTANLVTNGPTGQTTTSGKVKLADQFNHAIVFNISYAFNAAPPPPPPAPVPAPQPAAATRTYLVFFDWDRADLTDRARQIIAEAAQNAAKVAVTRIEVSGHADRTGTAAYNQRLSLRRADNVAAELVRLGVQKNIIDIMAYGDTRPLVPTAAGVREPQNRRVEIVLK